MKTAIILGRRNGVGLDQDAKLLKAALKARGVETSVPRLRHPVDVLVGGFNVDVAFHLERVAPWWWMGKAKKHVLIPNQERFPERLVGRLGKVDLILCKSRHAEEIFRKLHGKVDYLGFTSPDRMVEGVIRDYSRFIHIAGRSTLKNTELLLELWARHPEWPRLTLVQHPENAPAAFPGNVDLLARRVPDEELRILQNSHGIHLCPSLSEGWGHYVVEAMSCRAVVVTTDGAPMNELVSSGRGMLVPVIRTEPRHLGTNFHVDPVALEAAIKELMVMPTETKKQLGQEARVWYEENHLSFVAQVAALEFW